MERLRTKWVKTSISFDEHLNPRLEYVRDLGIVVDMWFAEHASVASASMPEMHSLTCEEIDSALARTAHYEPVADTTLEQT